MRFRARITERLEKRRDRQKIKHDLEQVRGQAYEKEFKKESRKAMIKEGKAMARRELAAGPGGGRRAGLKKVAVGLGKMGRVAEGMADGIMGPPPRPRKGKRQRRRDEDNFGLF